MGNVQVHDLPPVRPDERRQLKLTRKITPKLFQKVRHQSRLEIWWVLTLNVNLALAFSEFILGLLQGLLVLILGTEGGGRGFSC